LLVFQLLHVLSVPLGEGQLGRRDHADVTAVRDVDPEAVLARLLELDARDGRDVDDADRLV